MKRFWLIPALLIVCLLFPAQEIQAQGGEFGAWTISAPSGVYPRNALGQKMGLPALPHSTALDVRGVLDISGRLYLACNGTSGGEVFYIPRQWATPATDIGIVHVDLRHGYGSGDPAPFQMTASQAASKFERAAASGNVRWNSAGRSMAWEINDYVWIGFRNADGSFDTGFFPSQSDQVNGKTVQALGYVERAKLSHPLTRPPANVWAVPVKIAKTAATVAGAVAVIQTSASFAARNLPGKCVINLQEKDSGTVPYCWPFGSTQIKVLSINGTWYLRAGGGAPRATYEGRGQDNPAALCPFPRYKAHVKGSVFTFEGRCDGYTTS